MIVLVDTREIRNQTILAEFSKQGIDFKIKKLDFGDYSLQGHETKIIVERKQNLTELAGNFTKGRNQFDTEFCKGKATGCKMVLMVTDAKAKEKMILRREMDATSIDTDTKFRKTWRSNFTGNSMIASIKAFKERYDLDLVFCRKADAGKEMIRIFQKYLEVQK